MYEPVINKLLLLLTTTTAAAAAATKVLFHCDLSHGYFRSRIKHRPRPRLLLLKRSYIAIYHMDTVDQELSIGLGLGQGPSSSPTELNKDQVESHKRNQSDVITNQKFSGVRT